MEKAMSRDRVNTFSAESFTNMIGQNLNPGDAVVAVSTGYGHSVHTFTGIFEGVYRSPKNQIVGTRVGNIVVKYNEIEYDDNGKIEETRYDWNSYKRVPTGKRYNLLEKQKYRRSSLQRNRVFKIDTALEKAVI
jgi:hypothetical protein